MTEPRFYVLEHEGYLTPASDNSPARCKPPRLEVMILDRAYCHRVCWSVVPNTPSIAKARAEAEAVCAEWNLEDALGVAS